MADPYMAFYQGIMDLIGTMQRADFASRATILLALRDSFPMEYAAVANHESTTDSQPNRENWMKALRHAEEVPLPKRFYAVPAEGKPEVNIIDVTRGPHATVPLHAYRDARLLLSALFPPDKEE